MAKFHFNPATGEAGQCKAEVACPFGLPLDGHFDSFREATVAAEKHLKEQNGGSFARTIEDFDAWSARRAREKERLAKIARGEKLEREKEPFEEPTMNVVQYRNLMPNGQERFGDYVHSLGLNIQEAWHFAGELYKESPKTKEGLKNAILTGVNHYIEEAKDKLKEIDVALESSVNFKNFDLKFYVDKTRIETSAVYGDYEFITRVDETGKADFHVYEMTEGETFQPGQVRGEEQAVSNWLHEFKVYQDHLYLRVLWGNEEKRRRERLEEINKRMGI